MHFLQFAKINARRSRDTGCLNSQYTCGLRHRRGVLQRRGVCVSMLATRPHSFRCGAQLSLLMPPNVAAPASSTVTSSIIYLPSMATGLVSTLECKMVTQ